MCVKRHELSLYIYICTVWSDCGVTKCSLHMTFTRFALNRMVKEVSGAPLNTTRPHRYGAGLIERLGNTTMRTEYGKAKGLESPLCTLYCTPKRPRGVG